MATLIDKNLRKCHLFILIQYSLLVQGRIAGDTLAFVLRRRASEQTSALSERSDVSLVCYCSELPALFSPCDRWEYRKVWSLETHQTGGVGGRVFHVIHCYVIFDLSFGITWVKLEVFGAREIWQHRPTKTCHRKCGDNFQSADQTWVLTLCFCCSESFPVTVADSSLWLI